SSFIQEYLELKHMSPVKKDSLQLCRYFLPHHCVLKEQSTTTKLRVVFDGSASSSTGYSLNDVLMAGPTIQPKLFNTLLQFRTFPVALTGDICKMYRCVRVAEHDTSFPIGSKIALRDFYVDDFISGGNSTEDTLEIMRQTAQLLAKGGFQLRKWCSNDPGVLQQIPDAEKDTF
ncbi:hypothetical protein KR222_008080, partial [Zaprionus bogoriensis]